MYKLGKTPATPGRAKLHLADYLDTPALPTPPDPNNFGHYNLVSDWQMLGNDQWGDCAIAGPFHAIMLWNAEAGNQVSINTKCTLAAYSAITGFNPGAGPSGANPTDQGSNVQDVATYWQRTGLTDASGKVHKIDTYLALEPGNWEQLMHALYLFDGVGIGIECPSQYQQLFATGQVWGALADPDIEGGHYVLGVGARNGNVDLVTWGRTQQMNEAGYKQFCDEAFVYFSKEKLLASGKDLNGFNVAQLLQDLAVIDAEDEVPSSDIREV